MALFGDKTEKQVPHNTKKTDKISSATIITSCMKVTGNFDGTDTIHVDGHIIGNINVSNTLVIGKSGTVEGNVTAKHVIINGKLEGTIKCDNLEVLQTGNVAHTIEAKHLILDGTLDGEILGTESIRVLDNANIQTTKLQSKTITVNGTIKGTVIASEILDIGAKGFVEGKITVKNIKTEEGGRMIGTMSTYQNDVIPPKPSTQPNTEKEGSTSTSTKTENEDDFFSDK